MRKMSNDCEMKVMMVQRPEVRMKSATGEKFSKVGRRRVGQPSADCRVRARV